MKSILSFVDFGDIKKILVLVGGFLIMIFLILLRFKQILSNEIYLDIPDNFVTDISQCRFIHLEEKLADKTTINKQEISDDLNEMINRLPRRIQEIVKNYTIIVTDKDVAMLYAVDAHKELNESIAAFTNLQYRFIICNANECGYRDSLYHEIGHIVSYQMGYLSSTEEFTKIFDKENDLFAKMNRYKKPTEKKILTVITKNQEEYFAEAFSMFVLSPTKLGENCPETFNYMVNLFYY